MQTVCSRRLGIADATPSAQLKSTQAARCQAREGVSLAARSNATAGSNPSVDYLDPTKSRMRPMEQKCASKSSDVILLGAAAGVLLLGYSLDWLIGGDCIVTAIAIAAILAANALLPFGK